MQDPNFAQTVVLVLEHNHEGAFGLVVNRRSHLTMGDILPKFVGTGGALTPVYVGGPVQQEFLFVLHNGSELLNRSENASEPVPGVVFEPAFSTIEQVFEEPLPPVLSSGIHLFLGYSGWAPGQLEREMELGSWMTLAAKPSLVFHPDPEQSWKDALRAKGGIYKIFADSEQDPNLN